jgi:hypothetical protein
MVPDAARMQRYMHVRLLSPFGFSHVTRSCLISFRDLISAKFTYASVNCSSV